MKQIAKLAALMFCWMSWAQQPGARPGDKSQGEEAQIGQREQWFVSSRKLDRHTRPDLLRKKAVRQTRLLMQETRGQRVASWTSLGPSPMQMLSWSMGRVAGRVSSMAVDPNNAAHIVLGTASGGLWITEDSGTNWKAVFDQVGTQTIGAVYLDPNNSDVIWVGTGEQRQSCWSYFGLGLFRSTDRGQSWEERNGSGAHRLELSHIPAIVAHPGESNILLVGGLGFCDGGAAGPGGLYRTTDAGNSWNLVLSGQINNVLADESNPGTFYAAVGRYQEASGGIYKSTDGGVNWNLLSNGIVTGSQIYRSQMAMAPSNSQVLYALIYTGASLGYQTRLYRSGDGGTSWNLQNQNACEGQCSYNLCLDVSPTDPDRILVGTIRPALSTDGGVTLSYLTSTWGAAQTVHQDTHVVRFHESDPNHYWIGSDGGLWETSDNGSSFTNRNGNLNITQFYDIAVHPSDATTIFGGAQDNSSSASFNQAIWDVTVVTGDGFVNLVDPLNPQKVYQTSYPYNGLPSILRSNSGGQPGTFNWLPTTGLSSGEPYPWVTPLAICTDSQASESFMFVGSDRVYLSSDDGNSYTPTSATGLSPGQSIRVIQAIAYGNEIRLYVGTSDGRIFRCDNALQGLGASWVEITGSYPGGVVNDIAVDPNNSDRLFAVRGDFNQNRLYRSEDGGASWTAIGNDLPNVPANTVAIDPLLPNRIFIGMDTGIFVSEDNGDTVVAMMDGFPIGTVVTDLEIDDDPYMLTAGTYGRGAWQCPLQAALAISLGGDLEGCLGRDVSLAAEVSNSLGETQVSWSIVTGPDTSPAQFDDPGSLTPVFTPSSVGDYRVQAEVSDSTGTALDDLLVSISSEAQFWSELLNNWPAEDGDEGWIAALDRNADGRLDLGDFVQQVNSPVCR